jgi:hypothetical protein
LHPTHPLDHRLIQLRKQVAFGAHQFQNTASAGFQPDTSLNTIRN